MHITKSRLKRQFHSPAPIRTQSIYYTRPVAPLQSDCPQSHMIQDVRIVDDQDRGSPGIDDKRGGAVDGLPAQAGLREQAPRRLPNTDQPIMSGHGNCGVPPPKASVTAGLRAWPGARPITSGEGKDSLAAPAGRRTFRCALEAGSSPAAQLRR
jgi:hypothetical protein